MQNSNNPPNQLLDLVQPKPEWRILLSAADNSDLALLFAPHVSHITFVCATPEQAQKVEEAKAAAGQKNITFNIHDPNNLPYADDCFDLLVCHHLAHTVQNTGAWLSEASRIIRPQGLIVVRSFLVPGTRLRGKKARKQREAAEYINAFFQLRSSTHRRFYSKNQWEDLLMGAGFDINHVETSTEWFNFTAWDGRASLTNKDRLRLQAMLIQAPEKAHEFLTPRFSGDRIAFRLPETTILAISKANTV